MIDHVASLHPVLQALLAGLFTWGVTALGASLVFATRKLSRRFLDGSLGFTAGVMIAASFWSLLAPSILMAEEQTVFAWGPEATSGWREVFRLDEPTMGRITRMAVSPSRRWLALVVDEGRADD